MSRLPRFNVIGVAQHVFQRGNNRMACFADDGDRRRYLRHLHDAATRYGCALHAYVLMTNHVHLLLTPSSAGAVSRMMQTLGRNYAGYFNVRHGRTGTLWEGRFKACLVDSDTYLLRCYRYIEMNPVRAGLVEAPEAYRWSSHRANALGHDNPLLTPHEEFERLGANEATRRCAYRALFAEALSERTLGEIRAYLRQERVLGGDGFRALVEAEVRRCCHLREPHRPAGDAAR